MIYSARISRDWFGEHSHSSFRHYTVRKENTLGNFFDSASTDKSLQEAKENKKYFKVEKMIAISDSMTSYCKNQELSELETLEKELATLEDALRNSNAE